MTAISEKLRHLNLANSINGTCSPASEDSLLDSLGRVCRLTLESLQVASPVKTSAQPAKAQDSAASGQACGPRCDDSLASYDPISCSWKTCQHSLFGGLEQFSGNWPRSGMTVNGTAYRLPTLAHRIKGTASGLSESGMWPTPAAHPPGWKHIEVVDKNGNPPEHPNQRFYGKKTGRLVEKGLEQVVAMWPTPRATEYKSPSMSIARREKGMAPEHLTEAVKMWPTPGGKVHPNVVDPADLVNQKGEPLSPGEKPYDRRTGKARQTCLPDAVKMWPTPRTMGLDGGSNSRAAAKARGMWPTPTGQMARPDMNRQNRPKSGGDDLGSKIKKETGGQLNPTWVEWLMGYPLGWTDLSASETQ